MVWNQIPSTCRTWQCDLKWVPCIGNALAASVDDMVFSKWVVVGFALLVETKLIVQEKCASKRKNCLVLCDLVCRWVWIRLCDHLAWCRGEAQVSFRQVRWTHQSHWNNTFGSHAFEALFTFIIVFLMFHAF